MFQSQGQESHVIILIRKLFFKLNLNLLDLNFQFRNIQPNRCLFFVLIKKFEFLSRKFLIASSNLLLNKFKQPPLYLLQSRKTKKKSNQTLPIITNNDLIDVRDLFQNPPLKSISSSRIVHIPQ